MINPTTELNITGTNGKLETYPNSQLICPQDFQLNIKDGAIVNADYTTFQTTNGPIWKGINLTNPGANVSFSNCTFNKAIISVFSSNSLYNKSSISSCIFNIPVSGEALDWTYGIYYEYANNVITNNNIFNQPSVNVNLNDIGLRISNGYVSSSNNSSFNSTNIDIENNKFYDGYMQVAISSWIGDLPVYLRRNEFNNASIHNIALANIYGDIIENTISDISDESISINLTGCYPNFLSNTMISRSNIDGATLYNYPNLAPLKTEDGHFIWIAGKNTLVSDWWLGNIINGHSDYGNSGYVFSDYGANDFTNGSDFFHIHAYMDDTVGIYRTRGNCWHGSHEVPNLWLHRDNGSEIGYIYEDPGVPDCNSDFSITDIIINNRGNGIYDTTFITQSNNTPPADNDEALFASGYLNTKSNNIVTSVIKYKEIINGYSGSKYLSESVSSLYKCYNLLDTSNNQNQRNILFGNLKNYLENKIQSYQNNPEFIEIAFDYNIKCKLKMKNYQEALSDFAFIVNNNPSPVKRLMASLCYLDIEGLIQGNGGGEKDNNIEKPNNKPIREIILNSYKKLYELKKDRENQDAINFKNPVEKEKMEKQKLLDNTYENKALNNLSISSSLNKTQRRERINKDMLSLINIGNDIYSSNFKTKLIPNSYELSQNYPNPFNPTTNIKYQIQKTGMVTMKIYDITGRELKTLINEIKNPGSYIVTFNGTEFASGVYFYRIKSGDFIQVKKMMLIK